MSKTMFDSKVIETGRFLELKASTRDLYTHLGLNSDDEGFVGNPKGIARLIGVKESEIKTLINEGYLISFPSGVVLITNYWNNNNHDNRNNKPTLYTKEKAMVYEDESHIYRLKKTPDLQTEGRLNTDCKETSKEQTYKEITNKQTNKKNVPGLSNNSIFYNLSKKDSEDLINLCKEHNCDLVELINLVDTSISHRKEQTIIPNPFAYIKQVAENNNWKPSENSKSFLPKGYIMPTSSKKLNNIDGSLWEKLDDKQKANMKNQYRDRDLNCLIKSVDEYIYNNPEEEWKGTEVSLFKNIADSIICQ